jgi:hypothetical protein
MAVRRGYELKSLFWGRPIRPFHLAITISTATVGIANLFFDGIVLTGDTGNFVGVVACISAILLVFGWWFNNDWAAEWGLLLSAGCWGSRAMFALLTAENPIASSLLSFAWIVGASGAYILERYDHEIGKVE